jgi:hypothetical protein
VKIVREFLNTTLSMQTAERIIHDLEIVFPAESTGDADWNTLQNKPTEFPPEDHDHVIDDVDGLQGALDGKQNSLGFTPEDVANKGASNGYAPLVSGLIPAIYLPGSVDEVIEVANFAALPVTGETGKLYVTLDDNAVYRWSGSVYVEIQAAPGTTDDVVEGTINKYFTTARVLATQIAGYAVAGVAAALSPTDTILAAFGKIEKLINDLTSVVSGKQDTLSSGSNIKTINALSIVGAGDLTIGYRAPAIVGQFFATGAAASNPSAVAMATDRLDLVPFVPGRTFTVDNFAVRRSSGVDGSEVKFVVYSCGADGLPATKLYESTGLSVPAGGNTTLGKDAGDFQFVGGTQYWVGILELGTSSIQHTPLAGCYIIASSQQQNVGVLRRTGVTYASGAPSSYNFTSSDLVANAAAPYILMSVQSVP